MTWYLHGCVLTHEGVAANNRGEGESNLTTLQMIQWRGDRHTTVSAEAIRWALRYRWQNLGKDVNRRWKRNAKGKMDLELRDEDFDYWTGERPPAPYIDDDVLGFMKVGKGVDKGRKGALDVTRAVSLEPWNGEVSYNSVSGEKSEGKLSLYGAEMHATRYQYGFSISPGALCEPRRILDTLDGLVSLGEVAGNHGRFLFDFSPEAIVLRWTQDPAPRVLFVFDLAKERKLSLKDLKRRVEARDIEPGELVLGGVAAEAVDGPPGVETETGVKNAAEAMKTRIQNDLELSKDAT